MPGGMVAKSVASLLPLRDAVYFAMTGEQFDGRRAAEMRFVNRSVPRSRLREVVNELALRLAALDPTAVKASKESVKQVRDMSNEEASAYLAAMHNDLNWRHYKQGLEGLGVDMFLAKKYRPGVSSYTKAKPED
jgi:trans-feruloyl-CoA hydratase/vanillin synthase